MTLNIPHKAHEKHQRIARPVRPPLRSEAEAMLREIAFVLKMTERVREEMEIEQETEELALV